MLAHVVDEGRLLELTDGDELFAEGDPGGSLFLILDGAIELSRRNSAGVEATMGEIGTGRFLGELSLLTPEGTRQLRAVAKDAVLIWELGDRTFRKLLGIAPEVVARNLMEQAAENFRAGNRRWVEGLVEKERLEERRRVVRSILCREEDLIAHLSLTLGQEVLSPEEKADLARTGEELVATQEDLRWFVHGIPRVFVKTLEIRSWALDWLKLFQQVHQRRAVRLESYIEVGHVSADDQMLGRALERVLLLAFRLAADGTQLSLRGGVRGTEYAFTVTYWQPGMDEFIALRLFEPFLVFGRGQRSQTTWLDLTLASEIMQKMGGRAWLEHRAGEQITLAFSLPLVENR